MKTLAKLLRDDFFRALRLWTLIGAVILGVLLLCMALALATAPSSSGIPAGAGRRSYDGASTGAPWGGRTV